MDDVLFRWSFGTQDTVSMSPVSFEKYQNMIWFSKLSIASFQKFFPTAEYILLYNGFNFDDFCQKFNEIPFEANCQIINQRSPDQKFENKYHFCPTGVWWKWLPFRLNKSKTEIAIDTDIVCINDPLSIKNWINSNRHILVAPERYQDVIVNTCGDLYNHPILKNKHPINCGIVGQKTGFDFSDRFFETSKLINFGKNQNSLFINEQGVINVWARSLESDGFDLEVLDFKKNAWFRDFIYLHKTGVQIETLHSVMWYKDIVFLLKEIFEKKIFDNSYDMESFVFDILKKSSKMKTDFKNTIIRQIAALCNNFMRH